MTSTSGPSRQLPRPSCHSYGIPTVDLRGNHLVFFAGCKRHIAIYPLPAGDAAFQAKIAQYKRVKSTLQLPLDQPLPYGLVTELVTLLQREKLAAADDGPRAATPS